MRVKNDYRSKFSNLSNWKEAWKKSGLQRAIQTRDLRDTGAIIVIIIIIIIILLKFKFNRFLNLHNPHIASLIEAGCVTYNKMLYQLSYEATYWERGQISLKP